MFSQTQPLESHIWFFKNSQIKTEIKDTKENTYWSSDNQAVKAEHFWRSFMVMSKICRSEKIKVHHAHKSFLQGRLNPFFLCFCLLFVRKREHGAAMLPFLKRIKTMACFKSVLISSQAFRPNKHMNAIQMWWSWRPRLTHNPLAVHSESVPSTTAAAITFS